MNKMDMANAKPKIVEEQMNKLFEMKSNEILRVSAKCRTGIKPVLDAIVQRIKSPQGSSDKPLRAFVFDSWFDQFRGCYALVVVRDGVLKPGDEIYSVLSGKRHLVQHVGVLRPDPRPVDALYAGQVGFFAANLRNVRDVAVGDTFCRFDDKDKIKAESSFKPLKQVVFAGLFPTDASHYEELRVAVERLCLNDPSVSLEPISSPALGLGFRVGFLGLLHMEVFNQRLEDEYGASSILTAPTVSYLLKIKDNPTIRKRYDNQGEIVVNDPCKFPDLVTDIKEYLEPMAVCTIITPNQYYKNIEELCEKNRGLRLESTMIDDERVMLKYRFPLASIIVNFFGSLKKVSSGYASFDYDTDGYQTTDLVKMNILLNGKAVDEFTIILPRHEARNRGQELCAKLTEEIPRQLYDIHIQAAVNGKVIARDNVRALTKNFVAKLKGNMAKDRLNKLVQRQKEGKERMRLINKVEVPKEAFLNVLKRGF